MYMTWTLLITVDGESDRGKIKGLSQTVNKKTFHRAQRWPISTKTFQQIYLQTPGNKTGP